MNAYLVLVKYRSDGRWEWVDSDDNFHVAEKLAEKYSVRSRTLTEVRLYALADVTLLNLPEEGKEETDGADADADAAIRRGS